MWWRQLAEVQNEHQNGEKGDLSNFERGMVVGARLVWVFQKQLNYWDFQAQPSLGFTENIKYQVSGSCVDENSLLMSEENGHPA